MYPYRGHLSREKTILYQESCSCLCSFKLSLSITIAVFSLLQCVSLHCATHPSGLRSCPKTVLQGKPFPLTMRTRKPSVPGRVHLLYLRSHGCEPTHQWLPTQTVKTPITLMLLEGTVCHSGAWFFSNN